MVPLFEFEISWIKMVPEFSFHKELDQDFGPFDFPEHGQAPDRHGGCIPGHRVINGTAGK